MSERKAVLVTGAASGIGEGIAARFAEAGYAVAVFDINPGGARAVAQRICSISPAIAVEGDVSSDQDVRRALDECVRAFGRLDALVNNAGIEVMAPVADLTLEEWERQLAVNLRGVFLMSKHAVPHMRGRGGAIVNISSVHAFVSWPGSAAYDASKAGMLALTRAMAIDHGPDRIRVNAICPGYIDTPLMDAWRKTVTDVETAERELLKFHPLGRFGTARDVAEATLFLASGAAAFITGATLVVDGGMTIIGH